MLTVLRSFSNDGGRVMIRYELPLVVEAGMKVLKFRSLGELKDRKAKERLQILVALCRSLTAESLHTIAASLGLTERQVFQLGQRGKKLMESSSEWRMVSGRIKNELPSASSFLEAAKERLSQMIRELEELRDSLDGVRILRVK